MKTEQERLQGLITGSYTDFTWLYDQYAFRLYVFARSLSRSESTAKELVQETFIKVWIHRLQINPYLSFQSYLFTIARNQLVKNLRKELNILSLDNDLLSLSSEIAPIAPAVEDKLSWDEFRQSLDRAKQKLTPRQRELFEWHKEEGLSVADIAKRTSLTEQTVRNQLSQALKRLRREMKDFYALFGLFFL